MIPLAERRRYEIQRNEVLEADRKLIPMTSFLIYEGFDTTPGALLYRTNTLSGALAVAKKACRPQCPTVTVRDVLGGLRAEFHCRNERQGLFGREWDVIERITK